MKILTFIYHASRHAFYSWALREINPMHDDVFEVMMKKDHARAALRKVFAR